MKALSLIVVLGIAVAPAMVSEATAPSHSAGETAIVGYAEVYQGLADSILANKRSEKSIIRGILAIERDLALEALDRALATVDARKADTGADLQVAAQRIADFATEGGSVIEPIRNRLLQGGHHHHHSQDAGTEPTHDRGYVVVTRVLKRKGLDLAKRCGQLAASGSASGDDIRALRSAVAELAKKALD